MPAPSTSFRNPDPGALLATAARLDHQRRQARLRRSLPPLPYPATSAASLAPFVGDPTFPVAQWQAATLARLRIAEHPEGHPCPQCGTDTRQSLCALCQIEAESLRFRRKTALHLPSHGAGQPALVPASANC